MKRQSQEYLEKLFQSQLRDKLRENPNILCKSGHPVTKIYTNKECSCALSCQHCGISIHPLCQEIPLQKLTKLLNERDYHKFVGKIMELDNKLIEFIEESIKQLTSEYFSSFLEPSIAEIVKKIYDSSNSNQYELTGKEGEALRNYLLEARQTAEIKGTFFLQFYQNSIEKMKKQITDLKKEIKQNYRKKDSFINSKIVKKDSQYEFLQENLGKSSKFELLYRGSENNSRAAAFHQKCGEAENTLTLVRTEFGRTIAAFTPYKWHSVSTNNYVSNAAGGTCILSLDKREKLVPTNTSQLMANSSSYGPTFGGGHDLYICDQCNTSNGSYTNAGHSYNTVDKKYKYNDQASYTALSGATNGYNFKVVEYEVFRVIR